MRGVSAVTLLRPGPCCLPEHLGGVPPGLLGCAESTTCPEGTGHSKPGDGPRGRDSVQK